MDEHRTALNRAGAGPVIVLALAALVAGFLVGIRVRDRAASRGAQQASEAPSSVMQTPASPPSPSDGIDAPTVAPLLDLISADALVRRFFAETDWVRRCALVTDNIAEGASPRRTLAFAAPARRFEVERVGREIVIARESYRRYDAFAEAVASVSSEAVAAVYRAVHGPIQAAYRALGYPSAPFDAVVSRALHRVETAPVVDGDLAVRDERGKFVFDDERLESLPDVEKHLLRMGPRNTRLLQRKAREIRLALGLPPPERTARVP